jgi:hypothetical protein
MKKCKFGRFFCYAFRRYIKSLKEAWMGNILWSVIPVIASYVVMSYWIEAKEINTEFKMFLSLVAGTAFVQIIKFLLLLLFAPVMILQEQDKIIENCEKTTNRENVILRLSELRQIGVALRNEGERLLHPDSINPWWKRFLEWQRDVKSTMAILDPVQANQWGTLGTYTPKRRFSNALSNQHAHYLEMFDAWLHRLQDRIDGFQKQEAPGK